MRQKKRRRTCPIQKGVKIICPHCGAIIIVPMCQAVNGEKIVCTACGLEFVFGRDTT